MIEVKLYHDDEGLGQHTTVWCHGINIDPERGTIDGVLDGRILPILDVDPYGDAKSPLTIGDVLVSRVTVTVREEN